MDLQLLVETIKADKCVLLLGPEIITTETGQNFHSALIEYLNIPENKNIIKYYENDDFFLFNQKDELKNRMSVFFKIKSFYQTTKPSEILLRKIAQIPINLVVSLNPDNFFYEILKKNSINAEFSYFNKSKPNKDIEKVPDKFNPLIYNLMGDFSNMETLVLTHQDLFDFFEGAISKSKLPDNLRSLLNEAYSYIFVGFKFDKWYVQLLIRLLKLSTNKFSIETHATDETKAFYSEQFDLNFTELSNEEFIDNLISELKKEGVELRQLTDEIPDDILKIKLLIEKAKIDEAGVELKKMFPDKNDEVIMQLTRYNSIKEQQKNGVIDIKDYNLTLQQIKFGLLEMLKN